MRSFNPNDKDDVNSVAENNAKPWQVALLAKNPDYPYWGNFEDYMSDKKGGWNSALEYQTFSEMWQLDELNELVNFYFEVYRKSHKCEHCDASGLNPATKQISDDWYSFDKEEWVYPSGSNGRRYNNKAWSYHITDDEVYELIKHGRLGDLTDYRGSFDEETKKWMGWVEGNRIEIDAPRPDQIPSSEKVNEWNKTGFGHDSINHWICTEQRAKRLGVYGHCEHCEGNGYIYDEPEAKVGLQLWMLHPRKGCSRGVYIHNIEEHEVPAVLEFLKGAAQRNADRFGKL